MRTGLVVAAIGFVGLSAPLGAQVSVDVGPLYAGYHPLAQFQNAGIAAPIFPPTTADLRGAASGASLQAWLGAAGFRLATVSHSTTLPAGLLPCPTTGCSPEHEGSYRVEETTLEAQYDLLGRLHPGRFAAWLGAGASYVRHAGWTYAQVGTPSNLGEVVGIGASARLPFGFVAKAGSDLVMYQFDVPLTIAGVNPTGGAYPSFQRGFQRDAITYLSLSWGPPRF